MAEKSTVFEETYRKYLEEIAVLDLTALEKRLGMVTEDGKTTVSYFGQTYEVSGSGIRDLSGKPPRFDLRVVLCKYILLCPDTEPDDGGWAAYRDIPGSGPLLVYFSNDVENPIAAHYSGRLEGLVKRCKAFGGAAPDADLSYDCAMQFAPLPKIPLLLLFNDADDEFPASCSVLFRQSAGKYLDLESLAILGAQFSRELVR